MRRLCAGLAPAIAIVVLAGSGSAGARALPPVFAIVGDESRSAALARVDPRSLRPLSGPRVDVFGPNGVWAFTPDHSRLALAAACQAGFSLGTLQLVDTRRMRSVGCFAIGPIAAATWAKSNRLIVASGSPLRILVIDAKTRRLIAQTPVEAAELLHAGRGGGRLILLAGPAGESQRLIVAGLDGIRSVSVELPARDFVVEPSGRRAYVVSGDSIAEVELASLAVAYHRISRVVRTAFGSGYAPAAVAKEVFFSPRRTLWLGGGLIASVGEDVVIDGRSVTSTPLGLRLIDTRSWTVRLLEERATSARLVGNVLLAYGGSDVGLVGYDVRGVERFRLFRGRSECFPIESLGDRAYVQVGRRTQVVDVRTGRVLGPRRAGLPLLLVDG